MHPAAHLVTIVGVDANELATPDGGGALHVHGALAVAVALAVTARSVDLAVVVGVEVDNVDVTTAVVLDDLVGGVVSTATDDVGGTAAKDGDGILTDVLEPGELDVAGALAVDALTLVGTDDDVAESSTVLEDEDGILGTLIEDLDTAT